MAENESMKITVDHEYHSTVEQVFNAWLDPESVKHWLFATATGVMQRVEIDPRVGGTFLIVERRENVDVAHYGIYAAIERPNLLKFTFSVDKYEPDGDPITVEFHPLERGCRVTLIHEMDAKFADHAERTRSGWAGILDGLDRTLTRPA